MELYESEVDMASRINIFNNSLAKPTFLGLPLPKVAKVKQRYGIEPRVHDALWNFVRVSHCGLRIF
jgi:hypothetical protein